jgi:hypothetical protein
MKLVRAVGLAAALIIAAPQAHAYTETTLTDTAMQYTVGLMCAARDADMERVRAWTLYFAGQMTQFQKKHGAEMANEFASMVQAGTAQLIQSGEDPCLGGVVSRFP